ARVDIQSCEYMYTKFADLEQEWDWTELMPAQEEIERYLNFVADRLELRRDVQLETAVTAMTFDEATSTWAVDLSTGEQVRSSFVIAATGCLSAPIEPAIDGLHDFAGDTMFTNRFPKEGYDFTGKRVAVVGTGSSGVQSIPVIAEQADQLHVLQRSAAYTIPSPNRVLNDGELEALKAEYPEIRKAQWASPIGSARFGAVFQGMELPNILDTPWEEQLQRVDALGVIAAFVWGDVRTNIEANDAARRLYAEAVKRIVEDPQTAEDLVPQYPLGCKRTIIDQGYYPTFNRDNVRLVNLRRTPILRVVPEGIELGDGTVLALDAIVYATGFDAMTGALSRIDIRGRDGRRLGDEWASSPTAYLGLAVEGFPNLFTITGPGSPSVLTNMVTSIEHHVEFVTALLDEMRATGERTVEADAAAQAEWAEHVTEQATPIVVHESCNSWYLGANVPGKTRAYMPYSAGLDVYMKRCEEIVAEGYPGLIRS
ncbi:MAG TPA: NAD(P)/FAD-dependent oxidoreductase, partial [Acidimicrobiales bacterium]|nr:NAD(P)/FAD-dependent oxidoreductase [Acidimicrobiales bacterium]